MSTEDDEALAWAGDNDERLTTGSTSKSPVRKRVVGEAWMPSEALPSTDSSSDSDSDADEEDVPKGLSSSEGVFIGILGGIYLLFSAAWIVTALGDPVQIEDPLGSFMFVLGLWLAAAAPAAWFAALLLFGRRRSFLWRLAMLALGAVLVIPWPYFFRGA